jgi:hypothetical protein
MTKQKNGIFRWDFTLGLDICENLGRIEVKKLLREFCKDGTFQLEQGESGYIHYQGRVSLKKKMRLPPIDTLKGIHWSPTSLANFDNDDYCSKNYSRIDGPWKVEEEEPYIPRQIREIHNLHSWQQSVIDTLSVWDTRTINCLINTSGNIGKSTLVGWVRAHQLGRALPPVNDYKDLMRMVCDMPISQAYMIDMPRAIKKDKLNGFYSAIESLKDGYAFDDRYKFVEKIFDSPCIWVFTNTYPDTDLLSEDRWKFWHVGGTELYLDE